MSDATNNHFFISSIVPSKIVGVVVGISIVGGIPIMAGYISSIFTGIPTNALDFGVG